MSYHRYPLNRTIWEYVRALLGLAASLPLLLIPKFGIIYTLIMAALVAVFAVYLVRLLLRQFTVIELSDDRLSVNGPLSSTIDARNVRAIKLRFFTNRRGTKNGWMELDIKGSNKRVKIESSIDDFETLATWAQRAAQFNHLELDDATRKNYDHLAQVGSQ